MLRQNHYSQDPSPPHEVSCESEGSSKYINKNSIHYIV